MHDSASFALAAYAWVLHCKHTLGNPVVTCEGMPPRPQAHPLLLVFRDPEREAKFLKYLYRTVVWRGQHTQAAAGLAAFDFLLALVCSPSGGLSFFAALARLLLLLVAPAVAGAVATRLYLDDRYYPRKTSLQQHGLRMLGTTARFSLLFV